MKYILKSATPFMLKLVSSNDKPIPLTQEKLLQDFIKFTQKNMGIDK